MRQLRILAIALIAVLAVVASAAAGASGRNYIANEGSNSISVIDVATFKVLATVPTGPEPHNLEVARDGRYV